jgi:predicted transcriptional regulator of viral defense system
MRKDYVGLATILLRLAKAPAARVGSSDIRRKDETSRNVIRTITGRKGKKGAWARLLSAVTRLMSLPQKKR